MLHADDMFSLEPFDAQGYEHRLGVAVSLIKDDSGQRRCGSSVVEHTIGNGEVESSILSRSTSLTGLKSLLRLNLLKSLLS
jgi:hypothetical protein